MKGRLLKKYSSKELILLIEKMEDLIGNADFFGPIKSDKRRTVGILKGQSFNLPFDLLIKQFNYKNRAHYLTRNFSKHCANSFYNTNLKLLKMNLNVPELIGFFESRINAKTYCISRYINNADNLASICKRGWINEPAKIAQELSKTLSKWHLAGAVHGDLKWSNIMLRNSADGYESFFIDLDQSKVYPSPSIRGIVKDLKRFYRYGLELDAEEWVASSFFPSYISLLPDKIRSRIDLTSIINGAHKEWTGKGKRKI